MSNYLKVDIATGEILGVISCPPGGLVAYETDTVSCIAEPEDYRHGEHTHYKEGVLSDQRPGDQKLDQIKMRRNALLAGSDWSQLPDAPVDHEAWALYRQALRDFPEVCDIDNPAWPAPPIK